LTTLELLTDKYSNNYSACRADFCKTIQGNSIEDMRVDQKPLADTPNFVVRKFRVANSIGNIPKKGGYRFIISVSKHTDELILLYVYPKRGPLKKANYPPSFFKEFIKELIQVRAQNKLVKLDHQKDLAIVK